MKLTGLLAATYTPYAENGSINLELVPPMVDHMIERGVSGLYVCGSTGEGESLTSDERMSVAKETVDAANGRVPVVVQVGHNSLTTAALLADHANQIGADAVSSTAPTYFKPRSVEDLVESIASVAEAASDLPYYYYHIPRMSGVGFDPRSILEISSRRIPNFAGIKFSDFFLADYMACQDFEEGRFDILFGSDEMILGALATGAKGAVGSCYGFAAPLWWNIVRSFETGDLDQARAWMSRAALMIRIIANSPGPFHACVKQVIWPALGFSVGELRLPQPRMNETQVEEARVKLEEAGFLEEIITGTFELS